MGSLRNAQPHGTHCLRPGSGAEVTQECRTCSAAGPGQDAPATEPPTAGGRRGCPLLPASRCQQHRSRCSGQREETLGTAKGPLGAQVALGPFKNHRCT
ncbi:unnamed protein product [Rangifer tarandus platyrhynchus]|uniref:Uncharacterized protein n=1 Tax=Rangifer tarandus platyrhynchus TaxID=3082113 RepID=A0ABN8Y9K4_RANTA|nr:unnamed protein product [Rangifer tarandus platyrhynchus]